MEAEKFGEIKGREVYEADGKIIETYPDDELYPTCLIFGRTSDRRPARDHSIFFAHIHMNLMQL